MSQKGPTGSAWAREKRFASVLGRRMAYVERGMGHPIVFLHGNPTSSFLWRGVLPHVEAPGRRLIAPDLLGMGNSFRKLPAGSQYEVHELFTRSAGELLEGWFESDAIKALLGFDAIVGAFQSPYAPGRGYVLEGDEERGAEPEPDEVELAREVGAPGALGGNGEPDEEPREPENGDGGEDAPAHGASLSAWEAARRSSASSSK